MARKSRRAMGMSSTRKMIHVRSSYSLMAIKTANMLYEELPNGISMNRADHGHQHKHTA